MMPRKLFISYSRMDKAMAQKVADALKDEGYDVFWDADIPPGQRFDAYILSQLEQSDAAIVLWSTHSVTSDYVKEEAEHAKTRGQLVPVRIDDAGLPFGFARIHTTDLIHWHGSTRDPEWRRVLAAIESRLPPDHHAGGDSDKSAENTLRADPARRSMPPNTVIPKRTFLSGPVLVAIATMVGMLAGFVYFALRML